MNYTTKVGKPTAHITKKKSRLKVYNGHNVFLSDKDNFEFELYNPTNKSVLCKIKLNGSYISTSGIILRPGQRVFLERFLDTNNKFEFSTYKVKDTSENRSAIDLNGDVLVEFYDEQLFNYNTGTIITNNPLNNGWGGINTGAPYYGNMTFTTNSANIVGSTTTAFYSSSSTYTGPNLSSLNTKKSIETGRVEKGEKSNQSFSNSYEQFNYHTSHTVKLKILPLSTKNVNVEEIRQYCTECGIKIKRNFKFCPSCGNKL